MHDEFENFNFDEGNMFDEDKIISSASDLNDNLNVIGGKK